MDKAMGKAKEAFGAVTGDESKKREGQAQQEKAEAQGAKPTALIEHFTELVDRIGVLLGVDDYALGKG